jgi:hypothetical protein
VTRSLLVLVLASLAFWLVVAYPAQLLWGGDAMLFSAVAALLCLVPTAATLAWSRWAFQGAPEQQLLAVMGGTGVRMAVVISVGMILFHSLERFHHQQFWFWVIVFYLLTLALEVGLLLNRASGTDRIQNNQGTFLRR